MTDQSTLANAIVLFNPTEVAVMGNRFLAAIAAHEIAVEAAQEEIQRGAKREAFIDTEMIKACIFLHNDEASSVDLYKIFGEKKDSEILFRAILVALGVLRRNVTEDDRVEYEFTDATLKEQYYFPASMNDPKKESESAEEYLARTSEYMKRRSRRNSLNIRLARCVKAAIALLEAGATADNIVYRTNESGANEIVLTAGPKEVFGEEKEVVIVSGNAAKMKGATQTPTLSGIVKVADEKHKTKPAAKGDSGEGATRKPTDGVASGTEQDFLALVNATLMSIKGREGKFADAEKAVLKNLLEVIKAELAAK